MLQLLWSKQASSNGGVWSSVMLMMAEVVMQGGKQPMTAEREADFERRGWWLVGGWLSCPTNEQKEEREA